MWNASKNLMILLTEILKALRKEVSVNSMKKQKKKSEFFLNHEENCAIQSKVPLLEIKGKEIKNHKKIMKNFHRFYEELFSIYVPVSNKCLCNQLKDIDLTKLSME